MPHSCVCRLVQALGCILYLLCFKQHPFEDGAKLQIVNGKYSIPQNDAKYTVYHDLIRKFLSPSGLVPNLRVPP